MKLRKETASPAEVQSADSEFMNLALDTIADRKPDIPAVCSTDPDARKGLLQCRPARATEEQYLGGKSRETIRTFPMA